jgi:hypothetical protein
VSQLDEYELRCSRTLAFGFLWDTASWFWWYQRLPKGVELSRDELRVIAESTQLGRELAGREFYSDMDWNRANVGRFISSVGVFDRLNCGPPPDDETALAAIPEATYHITVSDAIWLEHLVSGMEWYSRVWDCGEVQASRPAWRTSDVMALAAGIYEERAFERMPILADALQDAGCDSDDILNHLRDPNATHVRGCWALDLVLGKS